ncbi:hypothetical protein QR680_015285 [Steinernema hermaphroditum]|uniref:Uncharacterized protein n=1 Tax=Steinernema hermaphroditum TaxID=289476 RepID=A0AA39H766_9BILA|nr:hypothetical protein QR680_015285 [Steinernema hermaphroditum]
MGIYCLAIIPLLECPNRWLQICLREKGPSKDLWLSCRGKMHFVVGLCLILLPFLIAYLIYYVIDLVYLMCVESCAKKGDTEAPADVSFSNPNFCKDAFAEDV